MILPCTWCDEVFLMAWDMIVWFGTAVFPPHHIPASAGLSALNTSISFQLRRTEYSTPAGSRNNAARKQSGSADARFPTGQCRSHHALLWDGTLDYWNEHKAGRTRSRGANPGQGRLPPLLFSLGTWHRYERNDFEVRSNTPPILSRVAMAQPSRFVSFNTPPKRWHRQ